MNSFGPNLQMLIKEIHIMSKIVRFALVLMLALALFSFVSYRQPVFADGVLILSGVISPTSSCMYSSGVGNPWFAYSAQTFAVGGAGTYTFDLTSWSSSAGFIAVFLYTTFDPLQPMEQPSFLGGAMAGHPLTLSMTPGTYTLVGALDDAYYPSQAACLAGHGTGTYTVSTNIPLITWCNLADGRLNPNDCGAPVAVYCNGKGADVYKLNESVGTLIIRVTEDEIDAVGVPKSGSVVLGQEGDVVLSRLASGYFQVSAVYPQEPKPYVIAWDACPMTDFYHVTY
jgi:hypothetical protein